MAGRDSYVLARRVGRQIAKRRREVGMTQSDIAAAVGVKAEAVLRWESGQRYANVDHLDRLSRVLGVTAGYFVVAALKDDDGLADALDESGLSVGERNALDVVLREILVRVERLEGGECSPHGASLERTG